MTATAAVLVVALAACGGAPTGTPQAATPQAGDTPAPGVVTGPAAPVPASTAAGPPRVLASGLEVPWAIAFLPGGDALVTERETARILRVAPDGRVTPAGTVEGVDATGELNLITPGANHGWPDTEGVGNRPGLVDPLVTWPTDAASPSGLAMARGSLWMSALRGETLWQIPVDAAGAVGTPVPVLPGFGRIRAVTATPDGSALWVSTSNRDGRGSPGPDDDRILVVPLR